MRTAIKNLSGDAIDAEPINYDWRTGYGETWESHEATACQKCGKAVAGLGGETHSALDTESACDGYVGEASGPMMNYFYPLPAEPRSVQEAAEALVNLPLALIEMTGGDNGPLSGKWGLALTGGGMDLSWEICEAFMLLGYVPPLHFAGLPRMAGRGDSPRDRWILAGAKCAARVSIKRAGWTLANLRSNFPAKKAVKS